MNDSAPHPGNSTTRPGQLIWREFCDNLAVVAENMLPPEVPGDDRSTAEGLRMFTHMLRYGLIMHMEASDPDFPFFFRMHDDITEFTAPNPDNVYWTATVRGDRDYRITGNRGTVFYLGIGAKAWRTDGATTSMVSTGEISDDTLACARDGSFEIIASSKPQKGSWLRMESDTNYIMVRQTLLDRQNEKLGTYRIERMGGGPKSPAPLSTAVVQGALKRVTSFMNGTARTFGGIVKTLIDQSNRFVDYDQEFFRKAGGDPRLTYHLGYFKIAEDEAWVVVFTPPDAPYWSFAIYSYWGQVFDARYRQVSINKSSAHLNADGTVTVVVSARDAGVGNWLDSDGHTEGQAGYRGLDTEIVPVMKCRVVKLADLRKEAGK